MLTELILGCFIILVVYYCVTDRKPDGMPPGLWGWPVVGHWPSSKYSFFQNLKMHKDKYGNIFTWRIGSNVFVFLNDTKLIKEAFKNPAISARMTGSAAGAFSGFLAAGISNNNGTPWMNVRRFCIRFLRDKGMGKSSLEEYIMHEADCLVSDFKKYTNKPTDIPWSINVAALNILWRILADKRFEIENKEIQEFQRLMTDIIVGLQAPIFHMLTYFPWLLSLIPTFVLQNIILKGYFEKLGKYHEFFKNVIEEHKKNFDANDIKDLTDAFLKEIYLNEEGKASEKTNTFTEKELLYTLADLYSGGSETTSSTLRWIIHYMANHEDVQKRVQNEIDNAVPRSRLPNLSDRENLPFLDAVIHEVMRLSTFVPLGAYHYTTQDTMIGEYHIPKATTVVSNIDGCHHDPLYWDKPMEFIPDRFILPDGSFDNKKDNFIPFSTGRRVCLGESLARMDLYLFAAALFQNLSFKSADGKEINPEPDPLRSLISIPEPMNIIIYERI